MTVKITYNNAYVHGDMEFDGGLVEDDTFETAVLISLFTERRASVDDDVPDTENLRGFWGDTYADIEGDQIGSKLWLLEGRKIDSETLDLAKQYAEESLAWMIEDGIADEVNIETFRNEADGISLQIEIKEPNNPADRWSGRWEIQING